MKTSGEATSSSNGSSVQRSMLAPVARKLLPLIVAIGLGIFQGSAIAQTCWQECEQAYIDCLHAARGDDGPMALCDDRYDACFAACF